MNLDLSPAPQESLDGFLRRLADAEFWPDVSNFLAGFGLRYGRPLVEEVAHAEEQLGLAAGSLAEISPSIAPKQPARSWRFERHHSAPVCPSCIATGAPHHQSWRHAFVTCCVEHGLRLVDQCPMCQGTFVPGRGGYDSCHCGCPLDHLESAKADDAEIAVSALIAGKMHPARSLLAPALAFRTPSDIGEFIFFLASGGVESVSGKQGKTPLPRTIEEANAFLSSAHRLLCDWPYAFQEEVARRLQDDDARASSAPAQLGRWYQRLMSFGGDAYSDFRKALAEVVRTEFDGAYVGGIQIAPVERDWISAAEAGRQLHVRAERLVDAVAQGLVSGRQDTSGFGHRHTMLHKATVDTIRENRGRFVGKSGVREFLGISRKQYDLFAEAGGLAACISEDVPPLVDGSHNLDSLRTIVHRIASHAGEPKGDTVAFSELNLRFTTDRAGLTEVFKRIIDGRLPPVVGSTEGSLAAFYFCRDEIEAAMSEALRGPGLTVQQVARLTGWKEQCIAAWCSQDLLAHETYQHAGRVGRMIRLENLARFQAEYVPAAALAKRMQTSSRFLMSRLAEVGVELIGAFQDGSAWRGHLVPMAALAEKLLEISNERGRGDGTHAAS